MMKIRFEFKSKAEAAEYLSKRGWVEVLCNDDFMRWLNPDLVGQARNISMVGFRKWVIQAKEGCYYAKPAPMVQVAPVSIKSPADQLAFAMEWHLKRAEDEARRLGNQVLSSNLHLLRMELDRVRLDLAKPAAEKKSARYLPSRHPARKP